MEVDMEREQEGRMGRVGKQGEVEKEGGRGSDRGR